VVADATCNTAPRNPLQVPMTISYLAAQTMTSRNRFLQRAAAATAQDEEVQQYVLDVNENRSVAETLRILVSLVNDALHPDPDYRLPVPTLLIHGDGDRIGDIVGSTRGWAAREPLAEHVVVPDAGHASNQDNPEAFNAALSAFLADPLRPAPRSQRRIWDRPVRRAS
jgi:3-oxoadipate enol-lactonase